MLSGEAASQWIQVQHSLLWTPPAEISWVINVRMLQYNKNQSRSKQTLNERAEEEHCSSEFHILAAVNDSVVCITSTLPGVTPPVHCIDLGQVAPESASRPHLYPAHRVQTSCDLPKHRKKCQRLHSKAHTHSSVDTKNRPLSVDEAAGRTLDELTLLHVCGIFIWIQWQHV